jgi:UDP-2,3-diacylglucosamine hydrolase
MGDHLVINGDLFEFWFEYRSVIPRQAFPTLEALAAVRRAGMRLTLTGGNHDRWGGPFWREQLGAEFHADAVELELAGLNALVTHGDGVAGGELGARVLHALTRWRPTVAAFRALHPDLGYALVRRLSPRLAGRRDPKIMEGAAAAQAAWARELLLARRDLELLVLGHTHAPLVDEVEPGRWYLNPGAFADGGRYAVVDEAGPRLARFEG